MLQIDTTDQAVDECGIVLRYGPHAVIVDIGEETCAPIDSRMKLIGGDCLSAPLGRHR